MQIHTFENFIWKEKKRNRTLTNNCFTHQKASYFDLDILHTFFSHYAQFSQTRKRSTYRATYFIKDNGWKFAMSFATRTDSGIFVEDDVKPLQRVKFASWRVAVDVIFNARPIDKSYGFVSFHYAFPSDLLSFRGIQLSREGEGGTFGFVFVEKREWNSVVGRGDRQASGGQVRASAIPSTGNAGVHEMDPPYLKLRLNRSVWRRVLKVSSTLFNLMLHLHPSPRPCRYKFHARFTISFRTLILYLPWGGSIFNTFMEFTRVFCSCKQNFNFSVRLTKYTVVGNKVSYNLSPQYRKIKKVNARNTHIKITWSNLIYDSSLWFDTSSLIVQLNMMKSR